MTSNWYSLVLLCQYSTSSVIVHLVLVVWVVDLDYYGYWTIKLQTKINKLMIQYISITSCNYILSVPHEVSKAETEKSLRTVCFVFRFLYSI